MPNSSTSPASNSSSPSSELPRRRGRGGAAAAASAQLAPAPILEVVPQVPAPDPEGTASLAAAAAHVAAAGAEEEEERAGRAASLDGVPEEARGVIELFSGQLAAISFPDVDAAVLERHAAAVLAERRAVEAARAALEAATVELGKKSEELTVLARRGLAYARIYAAAHPEKQELAAGLARLDARDRAPKLREDGSPAPRRGRPPKAPRPELPFSTGEREAAGSDGAELARAGEVDEERVARAPNGRDDVSEEDSMETEPVLERDE